MEFIDTNKGIAKKLQVGVFEGIQGRIRDATLSGSPERFLEGLTENNMWSFEGICAVFPDATV